ncbi:PPR10 [Symbiodinium sp. CCMP2456]|nr:PPR10 [Symbiodinium sp. CCMP2456]
MRRLADFKVSGEGPEKCLDLLRTMRERCVAVDRMHCTAALSACTLPASWPFAVEMLGMVQAAQIKADVVLYSSAISVLSRARWQLAAQLFWNLRAMRVASDITAVTAALHAYSTGTRWEACAWLLSHTSHLDSVACTTAVSSCEKAQRWEMALGFFATAVAQGIHRDAAMYNATIACSSQGGLGWLGILQLLHEMTQESIQKSTTTCNSVLTAFERAGCWEQALAFFREMPGFSLVPDLISYNATMTSFEKASRWEEVLSLLVEAKSRRMGDGISYNCCIAACQKALNWLHALALLAEMRGSLARPDAIAYNSAILASSGISRWETMLALLLECLASGVTADMQSWAACLAECEIQPAREGEKILLKHLVKYLGRSSVQVRPLRSPTPEKITRV